MDQPVQDATAAAAIDDDEMFDVVNLTHQDTGVTGTIFISTAQGKHDRKHGPRIKWFLDKPSRDGSCLILTLGGSRSAVVHGLGPRQARRGEAASRDWVAMNEPALLDFWNNGVLWSRAELERFLKSLVKLAP